MSRPLIGLAAVSACLLANAQARPPALQPLDDSGLARCHGQGGVSFLGHLSVNDPSLAGAVTDSRLWAGFQVDGLTRYLVLRNLRGVLDLPAVTVDVLAAGPAAPERLVLAMPGGLRFVQFGFEAISAQADPLAPVTGDLGRLTLDGSLQVQGQWRLWSAPAGGR